MGNNRARGEEKFMSAKRELREGTFILYFEKLFRDDSIEEIFEVTAEAEDPNDTIRISEESCKHAAEIYEKYDELNKIIEKYSKKRSVDRIAKINIAILHIALFEAVYDDKIPVNVAISEAVILAQKFAQEPDIAFINGVLGAFSRSENSSDYKKENE